MPNASHKDHHNRIRFIINWLREKYHDACDASTVVVIIELRADTSMYYFNSENDLKFVDLDLQYILVSWLN